MGKLVKILDLEFRLAAQFNFALRLFYSPHLNAVKDQIILSTEQSTRAIAVCIAMEKALDVRPRKFILLC